MDPQPHHAAPRPSTTPHDLWLSRLSAELTQRRAENLARDLRPIDGPQGPTLIIQGQQYIQFCTNNYLGLADDPEVVDAARTALGRFGMGAGASRLVAGSMDLHHQLETQLAASLVTAANLLEAAVSEFTGNKQQSDPNVSGNIAISITLKPFLSTD